MWFRVFATGEGAPEPADLLAHLDAAGLPTRGDFGGDALGWFRVDLRLDGRAEPLRLDRYLTDADDARDDLNAWAAWLETVPDNPFAARLMQHVVGSRQVFAVQCTRGEAEDETAGRLCLVLSRFLARRCRGVYQIDSRGFFTADGRLLVEE